MSNLNDLQNFLQEEIEEVDVPFEDEEENTDAFTDDGNYFDEQSDDNDDLFEDSEDGEDLFDEEEKPKTQTNTISHVATFFDSFNSSIADMIASFTGLPKERYKSTKEQSRLLAKTFVQAFPEVNVSPKLALIITIIVIYAPITVVAIKDIKELKEEEKKNNETSADDNSDRDE